MQDFLNRRPTCDLLRNQGFWKTLTAFIVPHLWPSTTTGEDKHSISSTSAELYIFARAYRTETGTALDKDLYQECLSLIEATALSQQRPKNIATFANVAQFIKDGIFGEQFVM